MFLRLGWAVVAAFLTIMPRLVVAEPMIPTSDNQVLEVLPTAPADRRARELRALRQALAAVPSNLALAVKLPSEYIEIGRVTGDPRYAGYAQSALEPWWKQINPPSEVLLLRAQLQQRTHQFEAALRDLELVLTTNPLERRARLQRATIRQVIGDYAGTRRDCAALAAVKNDLIATYCWASVMGVTGQVDQAYALLESAVTETDGQAPATAAWMLTTLAELAERGARREQAEIYFRAALSLTPDDQYALMAFADFLLALNRPEEVIVLVKPHTRVDGLLLRLAIALRETQSADAAKFVAQMRARFAANAARHETAHKREEARFVLEFEDDPSRALLLARENWKVQKEPADLRILEACATRADDANALAIARDWIARSSDKDIQ